ncbi:unnamed protein product, partial [Symbiodinium natans]
MVEVLLPHARSGPRPFPCQVLTPRSCRGSALRIAPPGRRRAPILGAVESTPRVQVTGCAAYTTTTSTPASIPGPERGVVDQAEVPTGTSRPLPAEIAEAERQAARQQRRLEMERELCEKLGLPEVSEQPAAQVRPRSAGLAPKRPPKPKPHRSIGPQAMAVPQTVEELPKVRRWKSAFMPLWLDVAPEKSPDPCDLAKTAPAAMSAGYE